MMQVVVVELLTVVDMIVIFIINGNKGSGNVDRGGGGKSRRKIIQCINGNCNKLNIVIAI